MFILKAISKLSYELFKLFVTAMFVFLYHKCKIHLDISYLMLFDLEKCLDHNMLSDIILDIMILKYNEIYEFHVPLVIFM